MRRLLTALTLAVAVGWAPGVSGSARERTLSPRIVQTQYGALRGIIDRFGGGNGIGLHPVEKFLGVPYATPPVNGLRFMPPITPSPWDGVRAADRAASECPRPQRTTPSDAPVKYLTRPANANSSEDCLYLNVFYPTFGEPFRIYQTLFTYCPLIGSASIGSIRYYAIYSMPIESPLSESLNSLLL